MDVGNGSGQQGGGAEMSKQRIALSLFWIGAVIAVVLAVVVGRGLYHNLRTLTKDELEATVWAVGGLRWMAWAFSVTLGSVIAGIGAFVYVRSRAAFSWFTGIGVPVIVFAGVVVWTREYNSTLFGIGGTVILLSFFAVVWVWMKKHEGLDIQEKIAGSYTLLGYIFWANASWFICGETAKLHFKAFEGAVVPSPIEVMAFLVLGWLFVLAGNYKSMRLPA
jgi:hypothetical protein